MITLNGYAIFFSHGDTFNISFSVKNYVLSANDSANFCIKDNSGNVKITAVGTIDTGNNFISVMIPAATMKNLSVGKYTYDLNITNSSTAYHQTLVCDKFTVKAVAHND